MNIGSNDISDFPISYKIDEGAVVTEIFDAVLSPGDSIIYEFIKTADLSYSGVHTIDAWIEFEDDLRNTNDSIIGKEVIQLPNDPVNISIDNPLKEDFVKAETVEYTENTMGLKGISHWDYEATEGTGKLKVDENEGSMILIPVDRPKEDPYDNNLIWTVNLSDYNPLDGNLVISFNYLSDTILPLSTPLTSENKVWVRGNDTDEWVELYQLVVRESDWDIIEGLNISEKLSAAGQSPSSSTQIKFSQQDEFGFTIDNITMAKVKVLPVRLISFTAQRFDQDVLLKWDTASEINNDYFEIQVAVGNEAVEDQLFESIGKVNGNGNTMQFSNYEFWDETPGKTGNRYYRLKQVDLDGQYQFSPIVMVNFSEIDSKIMAYPNPFYNYLKLHYNSSEAKILDIVMVDSKGSIIKQFQRPVIEGEQDLLLDIDENLSAGTYYIKIINDPNSRAIPLSKIRM